MHTKQEMLLDAAVSTDAIYQELLRSCFVLEPEFLRIRSGLSPQDQEILDRYISVCEELDHRRLVLALRCN